MTLPITLGIVLLLVIAIFFGVYKIIKAIKKAKKAAETDSFWANLLINIGRTIDQKIAADKMPKPLTLADQKRIAIENMGPKTFYYLDEDEIKFLYPQITEGLVLSSVTTRDTSGKSLKTEANIAQVITVSGEGSGEKETVHQYSADSISSQYNAIERYLFTRGSLTFGIEQFDFDEAALNNFNRDCGIMESHYGFVITTDQQEAHWKKLKRDQAYEYLNYITSSSGYVALQAEFLVKDMGNESWVLTLEHIINEFLDQEDNISIEIIGSIKHLTSSAKRNFKIGKNIQITCIGKVIRWDIERRALEISPIAAY